MNMVAITVEDMQRDLRRYLRQVQEGKSLVILEADHPVAQLEPFSGIDETDRLESEIDALYDEIRELMIRSADEPALRARIETKRGELRSLQEREADLMEQRTAARFRFDPNEGEQLLKRARKLLER